MSEHHLPIVGEDGPVVMVAGRIARRLAPVLMEALRRATAEGQVIDDEVAATVRAVERVGHA